MKLYLLSGPSGGHTESLLVVLPNEFTILFDVPLEFLSQRNSEGEVERTFADGLRQVRLPYGKVDFPVERIDLILATSAEGLTGIPYLSQLVDLSDCQVICTGPALSLAKIVLRKLYNEHIATCHDDGCDSCECSGGVQNDNGRIDICLPFKEITNQMQSVYQQGNERNAVDNSSNGANWLCDVSPLVSEALMHESQSDRIECPKRPKTCNRSKEAIIGDEYNFKGENREKSFGGENREKSFGGENREKREKNGFVSHLTFHDFTNDFMSHPIEAWFSGMDSLGHTYNISNYTSFGHFPKFRVVSLGERCEISNGEFSFVVVPINSGHSVGGVFYILEFEAPIVTLVERHCLARPTKNATGKPLLTNRGSHEDAFQLSSDPLQINRTARYAFLGKCSSMISARRSTAPLNLEEEVQQSLHSDYELLCVYGLSCPLMGEEEKLDWSRIAGVLPHNFGKLQRFGSQMAVDNTREGVEPHRPQMGVQAALFVAFEAIRARKSVVIPVDPFGHLLLDILEDIGSAIADLPSYLQIPVFVVSPYATYFFKLADKWCEWVAPERNSEVFSTEPAAPFWFSSMLRSGRLIAVETESEYYKSNLDTKSPVVVMIPSIDFCNSERLAKLAKDQQSRHGSQGVVISVSGAINQYHPNLLQNKNDKRDNETCSIQILQCTVDFSLTPAEALNAFDTLRAKTFMFPSRMERYIRAERAKMNGSSDFDKSVFVSLSDKTWTRLDGFMAQVANAHLDVDVADRILRCSKEVQALKYEDPKTEGRYYGEDKNEQVSSVRQENTDQLHFCRVSMSIEHERNGYTIKDVKPIDSLHCVGTGQKLLGGLLAGFVLLDSLIDNLKKNGITDYEVVHKGNNNLPGDSTEGVSISIPSMGGSIIRLLSSGLTEIESCDREFRRILSDCVADSLVI